MRTGTGQLIGVVMALSLTPAWAVDPAPPAAPGSPDYVVRKGDTLWGISRQLLEDPLLWPRLWEENPSIKNPNLIFPGERLAVPGKTLEAAPVPAAQPAPSPAPPPPPAPAPPVVAAPPPPAPAPPVVAAPPRPRRPRCRW
jgi:LysM repeat protein